MASKLTRYEIEAILAVAGNALVEETFEGEKQAARMASAYYRGIEKLKEMAYSSRMPQDQR